MNTTNVMTQKQRKDRLGKNYCSTHPYVHFDLANREFFRTETLNSNKENTFFCGIDIYDEDIFEVSYKNLTNLSNDTTLDLEKWEAMQTILKHIEEHHPESVI